MVDSINYSHIVIYNEVFINFIVNPKYDKARLVLWTH